MDKPRNAAEQAFWDAAFISIVGGIEANPECGEPSLSGCAKTADEMLEERRKRVITRKGKPDASP